VSDDAQGSETATYMVECYWPSVTEEKAAAVAERAKAAAASQSAEDEPVAYVGSILVPEDEVVFYLFQSRSVDAVRAVSERARIPFERVRESKERR
jgi:hypothetical protein